MSNKTTVFSVWIHFFLVSGPFSIYCTFFLFFLFFAMIFVLPAILAASESLRQFRARPLREEHRENCADGQQDRADSGCALW